MAVRRLTAAILPRAKRGEERARVGRAFRVPHDAAGYAGFQGGNMIIQSKCSCGTPVEIRTEEDAISKMRRDGKQAVYPDDKNKNYSIFRCKNCLEPLHVTVPEYEYESEASQIEKIEKAIRDYYYALDTRQNGGVAQDKAFKEIEKILSLSWRQNEELERRIRA
jgi:hypothetical protein